METSSEDRRTRRIHMPRRWWTRALLVTSVVAVLVVPAAWANHQFSDVPTASPHHASVSSLATAGITGGCAPGLYCPGNSVRRDEMASFLTRGLPRLAQDFSTDAPDIPSTSVYTLIEDETMVVPGVAGTQYVKVDAFAQLNTGITGGCPCTIGAFIRQVTPQVDSPFFFFDVFVGPGSDIDQTLSMSWPFDVASGTRTYQLHMAAFDATATLPVTNAGVTVASFPFNQAAGGGPLGGGGGVGASSSSTPDSG